MSFCQAGMREAEVFLVFLHMYFSLLTHEGQHFGTRTMSSNESQHLPVREFVVSSQHTACHQFLATQILALSEPFAPVFHQKWCSDTSSHCHFTRFCSVLVPGTPPSCYRYHQSHISVILCFPCVLPASIPYNYPITLPSAARLVLGWQCTQRPEEGLLQIFWLSPRDCSRGCKMSPF